MKKLIIAAVFAASTNAYAFNMPNLTFPTDWELGMISITCGIPTSSLKGTTGITTEVENGVIYSAVLNGEVVASSYASDASDASLFALTKKCL